MNPFQAFLSGVLITSLAFGTLIMLYAYPANLHEQEVNELAAKIDQIYTRMEVQELQLKQYQLTEASLVALGATPKQAKAVIMAAEANHISPKY